MRLGERIRQVRSGAAAGWGGRLVPLAAARGSGVVTPPPAASPGGEGEEGLLGWSLPGGSSGLADISFGEDYNSALRGQAALRVFREMERSDGQVRAVRTVTGLPVRATRWYVEPPMGASPLEAEAARLVSINLFGGMEQSFDDVLRGLLRAVYAGFDLAELEWVEHQGMSWVAGVWPRNADLVERWLYDERSNPVGALYAGSRPVGAGATDSYGQTQYARVALPLTRCIHGAWDGEAGSPWGFGVARSMYTHWYYKRQFYRLAGIGLERQWLGVPMATAGEGALPGDRSRMRTLLSRLRGKEDAALVVPQGWKVEWLEAQATLADIMPIIHHQDSLLARTALAQFLALGQTTAGTQALATELVKVFLSSLDGVSCWIERILNRQYVARWTMLNYGPDLRPPVVRHRDVRQSSVDGLATALTMLVSGELITPTGEDEAHLRALAGLPAIPPEQLEGLRAARGKNAAGAAPSRIGGGGDADGDEDEDEE